MSDKYRTLYVDKSGQSFIGDEWEADTKEMYDKALELERQVLEDIPEIETLVILKTVETIERENN